MRLRPAVFEALVRHGLKPGPEDDAETLRGRLNDLYLEEVRRLRERQQAGEIPRPDYARRVQELKEGYPLLGLPLSMWVE